MTQRETNYHRRRNKKPRMTASQFYEKYVKIQTKDGLVSPRKLTDYEKMFLDAAANNELVQGIYWYKARRRPHYIDIIGLKKSMDEKKI